MPAEQGVGSINALTPTSPPTPTPTPTLASTPTSTPTPTPALAPASTAVPPPSRPDGVSPVESPWGASPQGEDALDRASEGSSLKALRLDTLPVEERLRLAREGPSLIFDGVCNLCNGAMRWYFTRLDQEARAQRKVKFMWAQHEFTQILLKELGITDILKSWVFIEDRVVYRGALAWMRASRHLSSVWYLLSKFEAVPAKLSETVYSTVAASRYIVMGKTEDCQRPPKGLREAFLHPTRTVADSVDEDEEELDLRPAGKPVLLVVGLGFAGMAVVRALASEFRCVCVDAKEYFEFTPGVLRALVTPVKEAEDLNLYIRYRKQLEEELKSPFVQGKCTKIADTHAIVERRDGSTLRIDFNYCVLAAGTTYGGAIWKAKEGLLSERLKSLASCRESVEAAQRVAIVGAGLVGVELAGELRERYPYKELTLVDFADSVLPSEGSEAKKYVAEWCERSRVTCRLGKKVSMEELNVSYDLVLSCTGLHWELPENSGLRTARGTVVVNSHLQVLTQDTTMCAGAGRFFAAGDCVVVENQSHVQNCYTAEAMAAVVVANLRNIHRVQSFRGEGTAELQKLPAVLQRHTVCSLGSTEAAFSVDGWLWSWGRPASLMKDLIQRSKMSEYRLEALGTLMWKFVPHW